MQKGARIRDTQKLYPGCHRASQDHSLRNCIEGITHVDQPVSLIWYAGRDALVDGGGHTLQSGKGSHWTVVNTEMVAETLRADEMCQKA